MCCFVCGFFFIFSRTDLISYVSPSHNSLWSCTRLVFFHTHSTFYPTPVYRLWCLKWFKFFNHDHPSISGFAFNGLTLWFSTILDRGSKWSQYNKKTSHVESRASFISVRNHVRNFLSYPFYYVITTLVHHGTTGLARSLIAHCFYLQIFLRPFYKVNLILKSFQDWFLAFQFSIVSPLCLRTLVVNTRACRDMKPEIGNPSECFLFWVVYAVVIL